MGKLMEGMFEALDINPTARAIIIDLVNTVNDQAALIKSQSNSIDTLMDIRAELLDSKRELLDRITQLNKEIADAVDIDEIVSNNPSRFAELLAPHIENIDVARKIDRIRKARELIPGLGLKAAKDLIEYEPPSPCGGGW